MVKITEIYHGKRIYCSPEENEEISRLLKEIQDLPPMKKKYKLNYGSRETPQACERRVLIYGEDKNPTMFYVSDYGKDSENPNNLLTTGYGEYIIEKGQLKEIIIKPTGIIEALTEREYQRLKKTKEIN